MNRKQNSLMKFSRNERLAQLFEQEIVIEKKKKEILAKLEARKKKVSEEAFLKSELTQERNNDNSKFSNNSLQNRDECQSEKNNDDLFDETKSEGLTNAFSNDGSFLDQFKKLTQTNLVDNTSDVKSPTFKQEKLRSGGNTVGVKDVIKTIKFNPQSQFLKRFLDSSAQMPLPAPQVVHSIGSKSTIHSQDSSSVVHPSSVQVQQDASNFSKSNSSLQHISPVKVSDCGFGREEKSICETSPSFSNSLSSFSNSSKLSFKSSQSIPFTSKKSELPKVRSESISMTLKVHTVKKLEAIPNPLEVDDEETSPPTTKSQFAFSEKKENFKKVGENFSKNSDYHLSMKKTPAHKDESNISSALTKGEKNEEKDRDCSEEILHKWAQLVAQNGDVFEETLQNRNDGDLWFLKEKKSNVYLKFRELIVKYRNNFNALSHDLSEKQSDKLLLSNSPQPEEKNCPKIGFSHQDPADVGDKNNSSEPAAGFVTEDTVELKSDKGEILCYYKMPESEVEKDCFLPFQKQVSQEGSQNENSNESVAEISDQAKTEERRKRKRKSRWGEVVGGASTSAAETNLTLQSSGRLPALKSTLLSQLTRSDPGLLQYAKQTFGSTNLSEEDWKKAEDHYKINLLYQDMVRKRAEVEKLEKQGKFKYEYDSDEDTEGGTWEHKLRQQEMQATQLWAEELTRQAAGKHHIGDFLPPEELERFMEKYNAVKQGREPDLSDYKEFKLKEDNVGYRLLQKMGWNEGQGLGQDGSGITNPVNKAITRHENQGLGVERPDGLEAGDDEYDAYRKRMMLAYRFRPNPLNNPRRPYY